jgi:TPR repeat protein
LKAARNGNAAAVQNLGRIHAEGLGVTPDPSRAHMWFTIGARMGDEKSRKMGSSVRSGLTTLEIQEALDMVNSQLSEFQR